MAWLRWLLLLTCTSLGALAGNAPAPPDHARVVARADVVVELRAARARTDAALARRAVLAAQAEDAARQRDAAALRVTRLKQQATKDAMALDAALRVALRADEAAALARSAVAVVDEDVAREGAGLLRLYDRVLAERRHDVDVAPAARRQSAVAALRAIGDEREAVRRALAPVLETANAGAPGDEPGRGRGLDVDEDDDVDALLEKADLAHDLAARLRRRVDAVRARIREVQAQTAVAREVAGSVARGQLFDEEDHRLLLRRPAPSSSAGGDDDGNDDAPAPQAGRDTPDGALESDSNAEAPASAPTTPRDPTTTTPTVPAPTNLATVERGYGPFTTATATALTTASLAELESLEAALQQQLATVRQQEAALKKAAARH